MVGDDKRVVAIIQARMGSTRLPGKIFKDVAGKPLLWHIIERVRLSQQIDKIIIATTTLDEDDQLENFARENSLPCYRGEKEDVLARYYGAATQFEKAEIIARICGDDPLIDPVVIDKVIEEHLNSGADYTYNNRIGAYPLGIATEIFNYDALEKAHKEAKQDYEREHVTPYIYSHPEIFKLKSVEAIKKLRRPDLRLTVDTEEDLRLIREIFKHLYREGQIFYTEEVIDFLDSHPKLIAINAHVRQKTC